MDYRAFLERIPKIELHCHLEGSIRASTFAELAAKNELALPPFEQPDDLYRFESIGAFFKIYTLVCRARLRDRDDFRAPPTNRCRTVCARPALSRNVLEPPDSRRRRPALRRDGGRNHRRNPGC